MTAVVVPPYAVPASIQGLIEPQLRVIMVHSPDLVHHPKMGESLVVLDKRTQRSSDVVQLDTQPGTLWVMVSWLMADQVCASWVPASWVALDLRDRLTAAHVGWWVCERLRLAKQGDTPEWPTLHTATVGRLRHPEILATLVMRVAPVSS